MNRRIDLLALAVTLLGGLHLARPAPLGATLAPLNPPGMYCCEAYGPFGPLALKCCGDNWCAINAGGCATG